MSKWSNNEGFLNIGQIIDGVEKAPATAIVVFDFPGATPGELQSYRGYYEDLAIAPDTRKVDAATFLEELKAAVGKYYVGYKGGDYRMHRGTDVWVSPYSETSNCRITRVTWDDYNVILHTGYCEK